jgi:hypothetical protein
VVQPPLGPNVQKFEFEQLAQGAAEPPPRPLGVVRLPPDSRLGGGRPPRLVFSSFYFLDFFFLFKKVMGAFWEKNVKVVKLPQFESLGGLSIIFVTFEVKMKISG